MTWGSLGSTKPTPETPWYPLRPRGSQKGFTPIGELPHRGTLQGNPTTNKYNRTSPVGVHLRRGTLFTPLNLRHRYISHNVLLTFHPLLVARSRICFAVQPLWLSRNSHTAAQRPLPMGRLIPFRSRTWDLPFAHCGRTSLVRAGNGCLSSA